MHVFVQVNGSKYNKNNKKTLRKTKTQMNHVKQIRVFSPNKGWFKKPQLLTVTVRLN